MYITLSGEKREIPEKTTVADLIRMEQMETPDHVMVAVNDEFIERDTFTKTILFEGDCVEFLSFMGGG